MAQRSHSSYVGKYMFCDPNILRHDRDRPSNGTTSVVGQSRHSGHARLMSGLPRGADIFRAGRHPSLLCQQQTKAALAGNLTDAFGAGITSQAGPA
jgi:hypothetical protein